MPDVADEDYDPYAEPSSPSWPYLIGLSVIGLFVFGMLDSNHTQNVHDKRCSELGGTMYEPGNGVASHLCLVDGKAIDVSKSDYKEKFNERR